MPARLEPPTRTCVVTRRAQSADRLIRFVAAPDGEVVADLGRKLPGRGVWVTADAEHVRTAERKRLFARGLGPGVKVSPGLAERVAARLREAALSALSLARKAGALVVGFTKVEAAIRHERLAGLIHASDAAGDGIAKLDRAALARFTDLPIVRIFPSRDLDLAIGRTNVIHAALLAGPAGDNAMKKVRALADFLGGDKGAGGTGPGPATSGIASAETPGTT